MATLSEVVAAVVVHSSAVAFSHFGVTLDRPAVERQQPPVVERVVARSPRRVSKASDCPDAQRAKVLRV